MIKDIERKLREHIDEFSPNDLAYHKDLSIDFMREFKDRINFLKLYDIIERRLYSGIFSNEWYLEEDRRKQIQSEFVIPYLKEQL